MKSPQDQNNLSAVSIQLAAKAKQQAAAQAKKVEQEKLTQQMMKTHSNILMASSAPSDDDMSPDQKGGRKSMQAIKRKPTQSKMKATGNPYLIKDQLVEVPQALKKQKTSYQKYNKKELTSAVPNLNLDYVSTLMPTKGLNAKMLEPVHKDKSRIITNKSPRKKSNAISTQRSMDDAPSEVIQITPLKSSTTYRKDMTGPKQPKINWMNPSGKLTLSQQKRNHPSGRHSFDMNEMLDVIGKNLAQDVARSPTKREQVTQVLSQQSLDNSSKMGCGLGDATNSTFSNNFKVGAM